MSCAEEMGGYTAVGIKHWCRIAFLRNSERVFKYLKYSAGLLIYHFFALTSSNSKGYLFDIKCYLDNLV